MLPPLNDQSYKGIFYPNNSEIKLEICILVSPYYWFVFPQRLKGKTSSTVFDGLQGNFVQ